jgi:Rho-binding antiterminator
MNLNKQVINMENLGYSSGTPVNNGFYDEIESTISLRKNSEIIYSQDSREVVYGGYIREIFRENGLEYIRLEDGTVLTMDNILSINGVPVSGRPVAARPVNEQSLAGDKNRLLVTENPQYRIIVDRWLNRIYLSTLTNEINHIEPIPVSNISLITGELLPGFTLLNDLSFLRSDDAGKVLAPGFSATDRDSLIRGGLFKVADLVADDVSEVYHGPNSFSVNSIRTRIFRNRIDAENWLSTGL